MDTTAIKISDKRGPVKIKAKELLTGMYFENDKGHIYIKIDQERMAIRLTDGLLYGLMPDEEVRPVSRIKIVIE